MPEPLASYRPWLEDSASPIVSAWCPDAVRRRAEEASAQFLLDRGDVDLHPTTVVT